MILAKEVTSKASICLENIENESKYEEVNLVRSIGKTKCWANLGSSKTKIQGQQEPDHQVILDMTMGQQINDLFY